MLEKFSIPHCFIKALYNIAFTCMMINSIISLSWKITRGVWQEDPLSSLLFDLVIELLAASFTRIRVKRILSPRSNRNAYSKPLCRWYNCFLVIRGQLRCTRPSNTKRYIHCWGRNSYLYSWVLVWEWSQYRSAMDQCPRKGR